MNFPLFIAGRYLFAHKSRNVIHVIAGISAAGIAVGTAALILILSIFNGFDKIIEASLEDLDGDVRVVRADGAKHFHPDPQLVARLSADPQVERCCEVLEDNIFFTYGEQQGVARAQGVDAAGEAHSALRTHIVDGSFRLHNGDVPMACLGSALAGSHQIRPHFTTPLTLYFPDREGRLSLSNPESSLESVRVMPAGVFSINSTADAELLLLPLETMRRLLKSRPDADTGGEECSYLDLRLRNGGRRRTEAFIRQWETVLRETGLRMEDRISQNQALYKMMRYEKLSVYLVLIFVVCIIAFNIFGSLSMLIIEKTPDIGTLRALGCREQDIRRIFVWEGWLISLGGLLAGLLFGLGAAFLQQRFGLIRMPGNFQLSAYPVVVQAADILLTTAGVAAIGLFIAWLASRKVRSESW